MINPMEQGAFAQGETIAPLADQLLVDLVRDQLAAYAAEGTSHVRYSSDTPVFTPLPVDQIVFSRLDTMAGERHIVNLLYLQRTTALCTVNASGRVEMGDASTTDLHRKSLSGEAGQGFASAMLKTVETLLDDERFTVTS